MVTNLQPPDHFLEKPLPSDEEAERVILGGILLDSRLLTDALSYGLDASHFYTPKHKNIFKAMVVLYSKDERIDPILIGEELKKEGQLAPLGGIAEITKLTFGLPHFSNIKEYADLVIDKFLLRSLIRECSNLISKGLAEEDSAKDIINFAESRVYNLRNQLTNSQKDFHDAVDLIDSSYKEAKKLSELDQSITGVTSGFTDIDAKTLGFQKTDLIIIAARPSMGKTALCLALAQENAIRQNKRIALFSLEMSKEQLINRTVCSELEIDSQRLRLGTLLDQEWQRFSELKAEVKRSKLFINDSPSISTSYIRYKLRRLTQSLAKKQDPEELDLVIIDYMQLMTGNKRSESRQQEMTTISKELKAIAKDFNVPLIALSQLSRGPESRSDKRPILSDLRESGAIEQDADVVAFIYRDDYYKSEDEPPDNIAEINFSKHRNGPTGIVRLRFDKPTTRFTNLTSNF